MYAGPIFQGFLVRIGSGRNPHNELLLRHVGFNKNCLAFVKFIRKLDRKQRS